VHNTQLKKAIIRLTEAEAAATNVTTLLARVRAGTEIVIENDKMPIAVFRAVDPMRRTITECIELLPENSTATIDPNFPDDVRAAVDSQREPLSPL
jgi:antitoxin (DNA-binding transcriptional repressor) of toxin-antitoxin stability system